MSNPPEKKSEKLKTGNLIDRGVKGLAKLLLTGESDELDKLGKDVKAAAIDELKDEEEEKTPEQLSDGTIETEGQEVA